MATLVLNVIEKVIDDQNLHYNYQFGFHKNQFTDFFLAFSYDIILKSTDKGLITGMKVTNLQRPLMQSAMVFFYKNYVFDSSKHSVNWFRFYVINRFFKLMGEYLLGLLVYPVV